MSLLYRPTPFLCINVDDDTDSDNYDYDTDSDIHSDDDDDDMKELTGTMSGLKLGVKVIFMLFS